MLEAEEKRLDPGQQATGRLTNPASSPPKVRVTVMSPDEVPRARVGLTLLGGAEIRLGASPVRMESSKIAALLAYLALQPTPQTRQRLMLLFWGSLRESRAAANLRRALWEIRRKLAAPPAPDILVATPEKVCFNRQRAHWVDVDELGAGVMEVRGLPGRRQAAWDAVERVDRALSFYKGELLEGILIDDAPEFEEWLLSERERLKSMATQAMFILARIHRDSGRLAEGLWQAERVLSIDPWHEEAHRLVMELQARSGQTAVALRQFETCRRVLAEQLQVSPSAETLALYEKIKLGGFRPAGRVEVLESSSLAEPHPPPHNLPPQLAPIVGRHDDIARIHDALVDPACRLLTLIGPGGIGKTRLAVEAAHNLVSSSAPPGPLFVDGVWFVSVPEAVGRDSLVSAIAQALGLRFRVSEDASKQLRSYFAGKRLLLMLDAVEHQPASVDVIASLLADAPGLMILATSRERLRLADEWLLNVTGLPLSDDAQAPDDQSAESLFQARARRVSLSLTFSEGDRRAIARICRMVDGSPLAIELAAAFARFLTTAQIEERLRSSFDFLSSTLRDVPDRHRSLRAVFDWSWANLDAQGQSLLAVLSIFAMSFDLRAAEAVASATVDGLAELVDTSLIQSTVAGRYQMHEVTRRYAGERLSENPGLRQELARKHAAYFGRFQRERQDLVWGSEQARYLSELDLEFGNIRAAWEWATRERDQGFIEQAASGFTAYCELRGLFGDGERTIQEHVERLREAADGNAALLAHLLALRGRLLNCLGRYREARRELEESLSICESSRADDTRAWALFHLGDGAQLEGGYEESMSRLEESISYARASGVVRCGVDAQARLGRVAMELGDLVRARGLLLGSLAEAREHDLFPSATYALSHLGYVDYFRGDFDSAKQFLQEALTLSSRSGDRAAMLLALVGLGYIAEHFMDFDEGRRRYRESLSIARETGDVFGMARCVMLLGECARRSGAPAEAAEHYREALALARSIQSQFLVAITLGNLGLAFSATGDHREARRCLDESLELAVEIGGDVAGLQAVIGFAALAECVGDAEWACESLGMVLAHPATRSDLRAESQSILARATSRLAEGAVEQALERGRRKSLRDVIEELKRRSSKTQS